VYLVRRRSRRATDHPAGPTHESVPSRIIAHHPVLVGVVVPITAQVGVRYHRVGSSLVRLCEPRSNRRVRWLMETTAVHPGCPAARPGLFSVADLVPARLT